MSKVGIAFFNINTGETRVAETVEHMAAFYNSSDLGPNAKNKQDFGWRLAPEIVLELEEVKSNPDLMIRIASVNQIPPEDLADFNILKFIADRKFKEVAKAEAKTEDHTSEYEKRLAELRNGKSKSQQRRENIAQGKPLNEGIEDPKSDTIKEPTK